VVLLGCLALGLDDCPHPGLTILSCKLLYQSLHLPVLRLDVGLARGLFDLVVDSLDPHLGIGLRVRL
jgi:hypothetical protein